MAKAENDALANAMKKASAELKEAVNDSISSIGNRETTDPKVTASVLLSATNKFKVLLPEAEWPNWLAEIDRAARTARERMSRPVSENPPYLVNRELLKCLCELYYQIGTIAPSQLRFDFDVLYAKLRDQGKLPDLFDQMVKCIEAILQEKKVDLSSINDALLRLIEILRQAKKGSYATQKGALFYARFIKNALYENV